MAPSMEESVSLWAEPTYTPSFASIQQLKKYLRQNQAKQAAPSTWLTDGPQVIDSLDRMGDDSPEWLLQLSLEEIQEIEDAAAHFQRTGLPLNQLQAEHFPLPTLRTKLRGRSMLLHKDKPYFAIRGLKPQWFSKEKNVIIYLGIASHVGTKRAMAKGDPDVLHHITSIEIPKAEEDVTYRGPANRTMAIPFHNDYGEILALYTLSRAASGGDFYLADIEDVASRIAMRRPDLLEVLRNNYTMAAPGFEKGSEERPLLFDTPSNGLVVQASRSRLCNGFRARPCGLAPLTEQQIQAMDALHAASQEVATRFSFLSGDMLFFNNMKMMHSRDAYVDGCEEENTTRRYLLRLILKDELNDKWEVPSEMDPTWKCMYDHEDRDEIIPLLPGLFSYKAAH